VAEWLIAGLHDGTSGRDAPYFGFECQTRRGKYFYVLAGDRTHRLLASFKKLCVAKTFDFEPTLESRFQRRGFHFIASGHHPIFTPCFWPAI